MYNQEDSELLYEYSDAKTMYDAPARGKVTLKGLISRGYIVVLGVGILVWFLYSLIAMSIEIGFGRALLYHLPAVFGMFVGEFILFLSAFAAWGKFIRFAFRHNLVNTKAHGGEGRDLRLLEAEMNAADEQKPVENAFRVYRDFLVIINNGKKITLPRESVQKVTCQEIGDHLGLTVYADIAVNVAVKLPRSEFPRVRRHFKEFEYRKAVRNFEDGQSIAENSKKFDLAPLLFSFVCLAVCGGVMAMHFTFAPALPLILPLGFGFFGILLFLIAFEGYTPIIKNGVIIILLGLFFTGIPVAVLFSVVSMAGVSAVSLLLPFTVVHAVLSLFLGIGPMVLISGVAGLITSIRYRK